MNRPFSVRTIAARLAGCWLSVWCVVCVSTTAMAQNPTPAQLHCDVSYAGTTHTVQARPVSDPYPVESVDIGGRFRFKAVMVGAGQQVDYIKLYSYFESPQQPVLIQLAKYLPPFNASGTAPDPRGANLTGMQYLYAGPVERELQYQCFLQGAQP